MKLSPVFHTLARRELEEALAFLDRERPGTGEHLLDSIERAIDQLCQHPNSGTIVRGEIRTIPLQPTTRWPYSIYYRATGDSLRILAVAHQRRQPFYWLGRS